MKLTQTCGRVRGWVGIPVLSANLPKIPLLVPLLDDKRGFGCFNLLYKMLFLDCLVEITLIPFKNMSRIQNWDWSLSLSKLLVLLCSLKMHHANSFRWLCTLSSEQAIMLEATFNSQEYADFIHVFELQFNLKIKLERNSLSLKLVIKRNGLLATRIDVKKKIQHSIYKKAVINVISSGKANCTA